MSERAQDGQQTDEGLYVYSIIESDDPLEFQKSGIGGRGDRVHTAHYNGLAAVVSNTPMVVYDPTRENVLAHEGVNETVMRDYTVIPMSFGTVFRTQEDVIQFLRHTEHALRDVLRKLKGKIEFGLKANWNPDVVIQEIEAEREDIRLLRDEISANRQGSTYFARMQLGRLVEQAMGEKSEAYTRAIFDALRDEAVASRNNKTIGETMILNAAFLVERGRSEEFEKKLQSIADQYESVLKFLFTGPWPPYNFVNIRLKLETGGSEN